MVISATPFHGHVGPLLTIAADLVDRGHDVLFCTGRRFAGQVRSAGCRFEPVAPEADFDDRAMEVAFPAFAQVRVGPPMHAFFWRVFVDAVPAQSQQMSDITAAFGPSAIIHDTVYLGAAPLVLADPDRRAGRPRVIGIGVLPPVLLSDDTAPFGPGDPYLDGEEGRERNRRLNASAREDYAELQEHAEKVFRSLNVDLPDFIFTSAVVIPDDFLQLTVPGFEYPRPSAPPSFRVIGALPRVLHEPYGEPDWWPRLTGGPVVMVTQGTLANEDLTDLILPTVQALAGSGITVVAVTSRPDGPAELAGLLGDVPPNAILAGYVPFERLLPHCDVMVTNGGYGGVNTALRHGVPVIVGGDSEDKPEVAARVTWSGTGVDLRTGTPSAPAVGAAVRAVLDDPGYRRRATALSGQYAEHDPLSSVAGLVAQDG
ncbi:glycosyltransferase [Kineosporia mesophila]|uniref:Glycosyltransferase n=1 Tax=Kineosporia mesophila TaxID=566012 RepID=A0ABP6Z6Q4_9ACTN